MVLKAEIGHIYEGEIETKDTFFIENGRYNPGSFDFDLDNEYTLIVGDISSVVTVPKHQADYRHSNRKPEIIKDFSSSTVTINRGETFQIIKGRLSIKLTQPDSKEWFRRQGLK